MHIYRYICGFVTFLPSNVCLYKYLKHIIMWMALHFMWLKIRILKLTHIPAVRALNNLFTKYTIIKFEKEWNIEKAKKKNYQFIRSILFNLCLPVFYMNIFINHFHLQHYSGIKPFHFNFSCCMIENENEKCVSN